MSFVYLRYTWGRLSAGRGRHLESAAGLPGAGAGEVCPQSGDAEAGLSALVYGVPAPWQVTVLPSPGCQVTETGVAVAVTLSPGTVAVFDCGTHSAGLIHSQVGRLVSCKAFWAGLERITGLRSPRVWRASAASTAASGG